MSSMLTKKVGNLRGLLGSRTAYGLWHIDQTFTAKTPGVTFFWVLESPASGGGDTAFTSLTAAYKASPQHSNPCCAICSYCTRAPR